MDTAEARQRVRAFSVRVPEALYTEVHRVAASRNLSVNALVSEALAGVVEQAHDRDMYEAATLLGLDAEASEVEFAFAAQAEVARANG